MKLHGKLEAVINGKILDAATAQGDGVGYRTGPGFRYSNPSQHCLGNGPRRQGFRAASLQDGHALSCELWWAHRKNGNLLLNVPVKGDGALDSDELAVVEGITHEPRVHFGTCPQGFG